MPMNEPRVAVTPQPSAWLWWRRQLRRFGKHGLWASLALAGQVACRYFIPEQVLRGSNDVGGSFLQTFGSIYGIIMAFAMYVVWQQHNETQTAIEREAVSLGELYRVLSWFTSWPLRDVLRVQLQQYAHAVPLGQTARPASDGSEDRALLGAALSEFLAHAPSTPQEERLYPPALELFHELNEAREHRITVARLRLPEALRWFLFIGGAITVGALWLLWIDAPVMHGLFTVAMTWVVVGATSIVIDLDDPFTGDFIVDWRRFDEAARHMEEVPWPAATVAGPGLR
jgi:hypothetical protein